MKSFSSNGLALLCAAAVAATLLCSGCGGDDGANVAQPGLKRAAASNIGWDYSSVVAGQNTPDKLVDDDGVNRSFYVSFSSNYDANATHKLVVIFPGTDTTGQEMQNWLGAGWKWDNSTNAIDPRSGIEYYMDNTVFVYPDPLVRTFPGYTTTDKSEQASDGTTLKTRGWLLGDNGTEDRPVGQGKVEAAGDTDIHFVQQLIPGLQQKFGVSDKNVFVTGHSWGGDMAAVVGCYLGKDFGGVAPVAANKPYWFYDQTKVTDANLTGTPVACSSSGTPVWTWFGNDDEHFAAPEKADASLINENPTGYYGRMQYKAWKFERFGDPAASSNSNCSDTSLAINSVNPSDGPDGTVNGQTSVVATGCSNNTSVVRLTSYDSDYGGNGDIPGHYPPDYFGREVAGWFNSLAVQN